MAAAIKYFWNITLIKTHLNSHYFFRNQAPSAQKGILFIDVVIGPKHLLKMWAEVLFYLLQKCLSIFETICPIQAELGVIQAFSGLQGVMNKQA